MASGVTVKIDLRKLLDINKRVIDLHKPLKIIGIMMQKSIWQNFQSEGRPKKWTELSAMTKAMRARKGYWPGKILQQTGRTKQSIEYDVGKKKVTIGTNVPYARKLHEGGSVRHPSGAIKQVPSRPFIMFQNADIEQSKKIVLEHVRDNIR